MACTLMPRVIAAYRERHPDVDVRLIDTLPEHLLDGLRSGEVELAVGQDVAVDAGVERRTLFRDRHWLICPPGHPFARRRKVRWSELGPYTFIAPTRDFRQRVLPELEADARAFMLRATTQEVSYMTTALGMVASGLGLTVCPTYSASLVRAHGLQMVRLEPARLPPRSLRLRRVPTLAVAGGGQLRRPAGAGGARAGTGAVTGSFAQGAEIYNGGRDSLLFPRHPSFQLPASSP